MQFNFHFFFSQDMSNVTILQNFMPRTKWRLIYIDLKTDKFVLGQYLTGVAIKPNKCALSPDGKYFFTSCIKLRTKISTTWQNHFFVSKVPCFTAEWFVHEDQGGPTKGYFGKKSGMLYIDTEKKNFLQQKGSFPHRCKRLNESLVKPSTKLPQTDINERIISVKDCIIYANDQVLIDLSTDIFEDLTKEIIEERMNEIEVK